MSRSGLLPCWGLACLAVTLPATPALAARAAATVENTARPVAPAPDGMVWIPGGEFSRGCEDPTREICGGSETMDDARPVHRAYVDGFWMDATEVTNRQFAAFVNATGYQTVAERKPRPEDYPGVPLEKLVAGSVVFLAPGRPVPLDDAMQWWRYVPGADWRHPDGPASTLDGRDEFPVVHVAYEDAAAFAA
ncbi:MAG TPA: SUMF1/EgtB/PvdO family nonheme iron enzyme, partial [Lacunisphaera sp.]|nr:SUMF1/EgtB/PvdO family nonheme iron enzyme [Lacunisphaera sp.]